MNAVPLPVTTETAVPQGHNGESRATTEGAAVIVQVAGNTAYGFRPKLHCSLQGRFCSACFALLVSYQF